VGPPAGVAAAFGGGESGWQLCCPDSAERSALTRKRVRAEIPGDAGETFFHGDIGRHNLVILFIKISFHL